jgi:hypothetical protein
MSRKLRLLITCKWHIMCGCKDITTIQPSLISNSVTPVFSMDKNDANDCKKGTISRPSSNLPSKSSGTPFSWAIFSSFYSICMYFCCWRQYYSKAKHSLLR